jgi:hypothetical protein
MASVQEALDGLALLLHHVASSVLDKLDTTYWVASLVADEVSSPRRTIGSTSRRSKSKSKHDGADDEDDAGDRKKDDDQGDEGGKGEDDDESAKRTPPGKEKKRKTEATTKGGSKKRTRKSAPTLSEVTHALAGVVELPWYMQPRTVLHDDGTRTDPVREFRTVLSLLW